MQKLLIFCKESKYTRPLIMSISSLDHPQNGPNIKGKFVRNGSKMSKIIHVNIDEFIIVHIRGM